MCLTWPSDDPPSSAARANLHHFSSSPPLLVSPPTHTKKFPVSPPSFLIFHLDLFLLFRSLPCFTPTILLTLPPSSPFDCYHCAPQLPLSSYLPIFQLGFHHCCQYNPPQTPNTSAKIRGGLHLFKLYAIVRVSVGEEGHLGKSGDIFYQQPPVVKIM